jgi:peptide deformylase
MKNQFEIIPDEQTPLVIEEPSIKEHGDLYREFLEFAEKQYNAVGLAANQCNLNGKRFNHRIFALRNVKEGTWRLIIDPVITEYIGINEKKLEGCLTWFGRVVLADRYRAVKVKYYDIEGNLHSDEVYGGFSGQIWQHEINHLNGVPEIIVDINYNLAHSKIGRNDLCPCDSGKKYKQCCLKYENT